MNMNMSGGPPGSIHILADGTLRFVPSQQAPAVIPARQKSVAINGAPQPGNMPIFVPGMALPQTCMSSDGRMFLKISPSAISNPAPGSSVAHVPDKKTFMPKEALPQYSVTAPIQHNQFVPVVLNQNHGLVLQPQGAGPVLSLNPSVVVGNTGTVGPIQVNQAGQTIQPMLVPNSVPLSNSNNVFLRPALSNNCGTLTNLTNLTGSQPTMLQGGSFMTPFIPAVGYGQGGNNLKTSGQGQVTSGAGTFFLNAGGSQQVFRPETMSTGPMFVTYSPCNPVVLGPPSSVTGTDIIKPQNVRNSSNTLPASVKVTLPTNFNNSAPVKNIPNSYPMAINASQPLVLTSDSGNSFYVKNFKPYVKHSSPLLAPPSLDPVQKRPRIDPFENRNSSISSVSGSAVLGNTDKSQFIILPQTLPVGNQVLVKSEPSENVSRNYDGQQIMDATKVSFMPSQNTVKQNNLDIKPPVATISIGSKTLTRPVVSKYTRGDSAFTPSTTPQTEAVLEHHSSNVKPPQGGMTQLVNTPTVPNIMKHATKTFLSPKKSTNQGMNNRYLSFPRKNLKASDAELLVVMSPENVLKKTVYPVSLFDIPPKIVQSSTSPQGSLVNPAATVRVTNSHSIRHTLPQSAVRAANITTRPNQKFKSLPQPPATPISSGSVRFRVPVSEQETDAMSLRIDNVYSLGASKTIDKKTSEHIYSFMSNTKNQKKEKLNTCNKIQEESGHRSTSLKPNDAEPKVLLVDSNRSRSTLLIVPKSSVKQSSDTNGNERAPRDNENEKTVVIPHTEDEKLVLNTGSESETGDLASDADNYVREISLRNRHVLAIGQLDYDTDEDDKEVELIGRKRKANIRGHRPVYKKRRVDENGLSYSPDFKSRTNCYVVLTRLPLTMTGKRPCKKETWNKWGEQVQLNCSQECKQRVLQKLIETDSVNIAIEKSNEPVDTPLTNARRTLRNTLSKTISRMSTRKSDVIQKLSVKVSQNLSAWFESSLDTIKKKNTERLSSVLQKLSAVKMSEREYSTSSLDTIKKTNTEPLSSVLQKLSAANQSEREYPTSRLDTIKQTNTGPLSSVLQTLSATKQSEREHSTSSLDTIKKTNTEPLSSVLQDLSSLVQSVPTTETRNLPSFEILESVPGQTKSSNTPVNTQVASSVTTQVMPLVTTQVTPSVTAQVMSTATAHATSPVSGTKHPAFIQPKTVTSSTNLQTFCVMNIDGKTVLVPVTGSHIPLVPGQDNSQSPGGKVPGPENSRYHGGRECHFQQEKINVPKTVSKPLLPKVAPNTVSWYNPPHGNPASVTPASLLPPTPSPVKLSTRQRALLADKTPVRDLLRNVVITPDQISPNASQTTPHSEQTKPYCTEPENYTTSSYMQYNFGSIRPKAEPVTTGYGDDGDIPSEPPVLIKQEPFRTGYGDAPNVKSVSEPESSVPYSEPVSEPPPDLGREDISNILVKRETEERIETEQDDRIRRLKDIIREKERALNAMRRELAAMHTT